MCLFWSYGFILEFNSHDSAQTSYKWWEEKEKNIKKVGKGNLEHKPLFPLFSKAPVEFEWLPFPQVQVEVPQSKLVFKTCVLGMASRGA